MEPQPTIVNLAKDEPVPAEESVIAQPNLEKTSPTRFPKFFSIPEEEVASVKGCVNLDCLPKDHQRAWKLVDQVDIQ